MAACSHMDEGLVGPDVRCEKCRRPLDPRHYYAQKMGPAREERLLINGVLLEVQAVGNDLRGMAQALAKHNRVWLISKTGIRLHPSVL